MYSQTKQVRQMIAIKDAAEEQKACVSVCVRVPLNWIKESKEGNKKKRK